MMIQASPQPLSPDQVDTLGRQLAENGRVLATLDDWRAMLFVAILIIIVLCSLVFILLRANRQERIDMAAERVRMWTVADKFSTAAAQMTSDVNVLQALNARVETALGRSETLLNDMNGRHEKRS